MIVISTYKPKKTRKKKPPPEIKQRIVKAYSPKNVDRMKRIGLLKGGCP